MLRPACRSCRQVGLPLTVGQDASYTVIKQTRGPVVADDYVAGGENRATDEDEPTHQPCELQRKALFQCQSRGSLPGLTVSHMLFQHHRMT